MNVEHVFTISQEISRENFEILGISQEISHAFPENTENNGFYR